MDASQVVCTSNTKKFCEMKGSIPHHANTLHDYGYVQYGLENKSKLFDYNMILQHIERSTYIKGVYFSLENLYQ